MSLDVRVSELIKRIYAAGGDAGAWDQVAVELLQLMGCCAGVATLADLGRMQLIACRAYGPRSSSFSAGIEEYSSRYREDPTLQWASLHPGARLCDSRQTLPGGEYPHHHFVRWTKSRFHSTHWYLAFASPAEDLTITFAAHFAGEHTQDTPDALNLFRTVFDHVECALRIGNRSFSHESARSLLLLNSEGAIEQMSSGADLLLRNRPAFRIVGGRLITNCPADQANIDNAIKRALGTGPGSDSPITMRLEHEYGRPWIVVVRPITVNYGPFGSVRRQLQVEIFDRMPTMKRLEVIQSVFDLTARELQILRLLVEGHSIDSLSTTISVSRNTTRAHLRSIFLKTRTSSQSELMQVCGGLCQASAQESLELAD
jgi:DNA-binding CsgD family transcriptional regulator